MVLLICYVCFAFFTGVLRGLTGAKLFRKKFNQKLEFYEEGLREVTGVYESSPFKK